MPRATNHSKKVKRVLYLAVGAVVCALVFVYVNYRSTFDLRSEAPADLDPDATLALKNISQTATRNGITEWHLKAKTAHYNNSKSQATLTDLSIVFYLEDGRQLLLEASHGILETDSRDIRVYDDVILKDAAYRLETRQLNYSHRRRIIFSETPVRISGESLNITADALYYDLSSSRIRLDGSVKGSFNHAIAL